MSNQDLEKIQQIRTFFENRNMYRNEVETFTTRYPLNERCLIARINTLTFRVEIFYVGQVLDKNETTGNIRLKLLDIINPKTGKTKKKANNYSSTIELMPNNIDKPWVYAYLTFANLNKLLNTTTKLNRSTSNQSFLQEPSLIDSSPASSIQQKKRKVRIETQPEQQAVHPLSKKPDEEFVFNPNVFNDDDTSNELPIIADSPSSKKGGKRKTKKRKSKKSKTLKKRKTTKKR